MCGRFAMNEDVDDLIRDFVAAGGRAGDWRPSYSIAPTDPAPIVREWQPEGADAPTREVTLATWDWPQPAGQPRRGPIINARLEKLDQRFWVGAFSNARCIVPMLGYYEWTGEKGAKQPHFIHGDGLLAAAGVSWASQDADGQWSRVFAVVTREARDASGEVHDRMPAFLEPDTWSTWLNPQSITTADRTESAAKRQAMIDLLDRTSTAVAATMHTRLVDRRVNSVRAIDPQDATLIEALPG
jgi:putative SOS response-associated peptidase YedK